MARARRRDSRPDSRPRRAERFGPGVRDEVNEPLGRTPLAPSLAARSKRPAPRLAVGLALAAAGLAVAAIVRSGNGGGEPFAVARIEAASPAALPAPPAAAPAAALPPSATGDQIEAASGVKVVRNGGGGASDALIIDVPQTLRVRLVAAPDKRLVEKSRYGLLPRIGANGARPAEVYARPIVASARLPAGAPRVAVMVGGLGINAEGTANAIDRLPGAVSLGFAPYGGDLEREAAEAREAGHETLLQAPMEPFDYPENNPGPHTLRVDAGDLDDLHWLMGRFAGYAGVMNFMGGRFTSDEKALSPVLADIAQRGLFFLDDGAAPQSLVGSVAARASLPVARVEVILDARGTPQSLDAALAQLEAEARKSGSAIGFANAQGPTIARLARFAREVERRGVAIAPVSATLAPGGATAAAIGAGK